MKGPILRLLICFMLVADSIYAADFTNFINMEFNNISAGVFFMGSCNPPEGEQKETSTLFGLVTTSVCPSGGSIDSMAESDELPQHKIEISKSFQMGTYEVTLEQFMVYITATGRPVSENFKKHNSHGEKSAVTWVSWFQVQSFLDWMNQNKSADDQGKYRLPTEAEWEYAARAGTITTYFFGDRSFGISRFAWIIKDSQSYGQIWSQPVGIKQPNPWGLYDIYGNVQEWIQDVYAENYYQASSPSNPKGPDTGRSQVIRGCSLYSSAKNCRSAKRFQLVADQRKGTIGFRVVRELP